MVFYLVSDRICKLGVRAHATTLVLSVLMHDLSKKIEENKKIYRDRERKTVANRATLRLLWATLILGLGEYLSLANHRSKT